jgi:hypothetical protein
MHDWYHAGNGIFLAGSSAQESSAKGAFFRLRDFDADRGDPFEMCLAAHNLRLALRRDVGLFESNPNENAAGLSPELTCWKRPNRMPTDTIVRTTRRIAVVLHGPPCGGKSTVRDILLDQHSGRPRMVSLVDGWLGTGRHEHTFRYDNESTRSGDLRAGSERPNVHSRREI